MYIDIVPVPSRWWSRYLFGGIEAFQCTEWVAPPQCPEESPGRMRRDKEAMLALNTANEGTSKFASLSRRRRQQDAMLKVTELGTIAKSFLAKGPIVRPFCFGDCAVGNTDLRRKIEGELRISGTEGCSTITMAGHIPTLTLASVVFVILNELDPDFADTLVNVMGPLGYLGIYIIHTPRERDEEREREIESERERERERERDEERERARVRERKSTHAYTTAAAAATTTTTTTNNNHNTTKNSKCKTW